MPPATAHAPIAPRIHIPGDKGFVNIAADDNRLVAHGDQLSAEQEAQRLARKEGKPVIVFRPVVVISPPPKIDLPPCTACDVSAVARFDVPRS